MTIPDSKERVAANLVKRAAIVLRSGHIDFQDFYRDEQDQRIYLNSMIPILGTEDSDPGHETTFNIYLPASEREVIREKTEAGTITTETLLLVDDEKMVLEVSREMLD